VVSSLSFSPDGKYLASASWDGLVMIWDFVSGVVVETLKGHYFEVLSVKFSPDGKTIATASSDCTIKIWEFLPFDELVQKAMKKCENRQLTPEERRQYYIE
jgi:WD40 repeat protein